jgi:acetyl esterase
LIDFFNDMYFGDVDIDLKDPRLCPALAQKLSGAPPAHIITAEYDPLRDEGEEYSQLLSAAGVQATYRCYEGLMHNFILQTAVVELASQAVSDCASFLRQQLA